MHQYDDFNMFDVLSAAGGEIPKQLVCPSCGRRGPPSTMKHVGGDDHFGHMFVCSAEFLRLMADRERSRAPADTGWDSELGTQTKNTRNRLLDASVWTVLPGTPLRNWQEWADYRGKLNSLTIDFDSPGAVLWPEEPRKVY
jgi:hypothetical protein